MNNSIANVAETFIPPRVDTAPQKSNSTFARQRQDFAPVENTRTDRPERASETPSKTDAEGQVNSGGKEDKQDFNEVLAKKMSNKESKPEKKEPETSDSEVGSAELSSPGILIAETKIPEKIVNNKISPLIDTIRAKQNVQADTEKPGIIDATGKKSITKNLAEVTPVKEVVTPVDKIVANTKEVKNETIGIPIKTLVDEPKPNKLATSLAQSAEKVQINAEKSNLVQPQTVQPETLKTEGVQAVPKKLQNNENQFATNKNLNLAQAEQNKITTPVTKVEQKPVISQSEDIPQAGFQNKFDKSIANAKNDAASNSSMTSNPQSNTAANTDTVLTPPGTANKELHKTLSKEFGSETNSENLTNVSADSDSKAVTGNTSRLDFKPQSGNSILNQVTEHIRSSMTRGREQISIALDPPELGRVMIKFQKNNGEIVGIVEVDKARTHQEIADEMPVIVKSLNDSGVLVKRVEVVLTEQNTQDALNDNSANENNNTGRQSLGGSSDNSQNEGSGTGSRNFSKQYNPANNTDNYINTVSDDAINMYA